MATILKWQARVETCLAHISRSELYRKARMIRPDTLVSLAALHPDPSTEVAQALCHSALYNLADSFSEQDQQAIRDFRAAARACYAKLSKATRSKLVEVGDLALANSTVQDAEKRFEEEVEATNAFWEAATKSSVGANRLEEDFTLGKGAGWASKGSE
ncbi:unnamed protein product [Effrenium voratum]|nr:unnamed protein product [Effrenium voratum]